MSDRKDVGLAKSISFGPMNLSSLPTDAEERRRLGAKVEENLKGFFLQNLSEADRELWEARNAEAWPKEAHVRIFSAFDDVICKRAEDFGWRILESPWVRTRVQQWYEGHDRGVERLERLFKAIIWGARRMRGEVRSVPTDPAWRLAKENAVPELRLVLKQHQSEFRQRRRTPSHEENLEWFRRTVTISELFPFLAQNLRSLIGFLENIREHNQTFARRLLNANVNPGEFFDIWAAWGSNLTPETLRQALTKL
jgi:hypothetical protein